MKRVRIDLERIIDIDALAQAAYRARAGKKRVRRHVHFFLDLEARLAVIRAELLSGLAPYGRYATFVVHDPKRRTIHAACFADRVIHHALMAQVGPVLDVSLIEQTYACRIGRGPIAAMHRAWAGLRRYPWFVQIDVHRFFDTIDHSILKGLVRRRIKGSVLPVLDRIIDSFHSEPDRGLPIGSLTSQHLANFYLAGLDRFLTAQRGARHYVRYMDDCIWWAQSQDEARSMLQAARHWLWNERRMTLQERSTNLLPSAQGVTFCGFRLVPESIRLTRRRKRRFAMLRRQWEKDYVGDRLTAQELQQRYASLLAMSRHAASTGWRRQELFRHGQVAA